MKKILFIHSESEIGGEVFITSKSELFSQITSLLSFAESDFVIESIQDKLDFFEVIILLLYGELDKRIEPELPKNLYLPEDQMYRHITLQKVDYKFLQGHEKDGKILILLELKELINKSILESKNIVGKYISRKGEAYHPA